MANTTAHAHGPRTSCWAEQILSLKTKCNHHSCSGIHRCCLAPWPPAKSHRVCPHRKGRESATTTCQLKPSKSKLNLSIAETNTALRELTKHLHYTELVQTRILEEGRLRDFSLFSTSTSPWFMIWYSMRTERFEVFFSKKKYSTPYNSTLVHL